MQNMCYEWKHNTGQNEKKVNIWQLSKAGGAGPRLYIVCILRFWFWPRNSILLLNATQISVWSSRNKDSASFWSPITGDPLALRNGMCPWPCSSFPLWLQVKEVYRQLLTEKIFPTVLLKILFNYFEKAKHICFATIVFYPGTNF